jgi:hypothetical protein
VLPQSIFKVLCVYSVWDRASKLASTAGALTLDFVNEISRLCFAS